MAESRGAGGRVVEVPLRRLGRWMAGFGARHGACQVEQRAGAEGDHGPLDGRGPSHGGDGSAQPSWTVRAADASTAVIVAPPWLAHLAGVHVRTPDDLVDLRPAYGVLLVRRAGYAVALVEGDRIAEQKVGSRHVHGRTAAGGWSQQRYARRRNNEAEEIAAAAAAAATRIVGTATEDGQAPGFLVTGGDRLLLASARALLGPGVSDLPVAIHLGVGTPDRSLLAGVPDRVRAVTIEVHDAASPS